ncbi:hypothetical protein [Pantoea sp.]|uniref:hypothetical protein n=1 Tax=Pantoea sp. TaxID=69393 RepID=UPI0028AD1DCC|nr:hypothetical protein [Pantoea sp.]
MEKIILYYELRATVRDHVGKYETRNEKLLGTVDQPYHAISNGFLNFRDGDDTKGIALTDIHSYCFRPVFKE